MLRVEGLGVRYGALVALDDVSWEVAAGEILGIIGPNGAGKTTLFNVLNGVLPADDGHAWLDGEPLRGRKLHAVCRMGVGRTFQVVRSFPRLALLDNVLIGAYGAGLTGEAATRAAEEALARVGLLDQLGRPAGQLTNKDLRLMELARALAGRPRLLLLDEPAAGLDDRESADLANAIVRIRDDNGCAVLLVEHDMHVIFRVCERIQVVDFGKTIALGTPNEIRANPAVIAAYLGAKGAQDVVEAG